MDIQASLEPLVDKLQGWLEGAIALLPNLLVAMLVLAVFVAVAGIAKKVATRVSESMGANVAITRLMATIFKYAVIAAGFLVALGVVGLQKTVVSLLAGAGVLGLAVGFAFQDLAANFIAGIAMGFRKPFDIGDVIRTSSYFGEVMAINLRNTVIRDFDGQRIIIPNREVFENALINYSANGERRVEVEVGVGYDEDLESATRIAREAIESLDARAQDSTVQVIAHEFGGSSINFKIRFWIDYPDQSYPAAQHDAVVAIKKAFDAHEIGIPFPIRTLDLSGVDKHFHPLMVDREVVEAVA